MPDAFPLLMDRVAQIAATTPGLELLVLFGSRATGQFHAGSDWDFGYIVTDEADVSALLGRIVEIVGSDRVDLVDLRSASGLLRYRAACDGRLLFEARPSTWDQLRLDAVRFWCDAAPVLQRGYDDALADLKR